MLNGALNCNENTILMSISQFTIPSIPTLAYTLHNLRSVQTIRQLLKNQMPCEAVVCVFIFLYQLLLPVTQDTSHI